MEILYNTLIDLNKSEKNKLVLRGEFVWGIDVRQSIQ